MLNLNKFTYYENILLMGFPLIRVRKISELELTFGVCVENSIEERENLKFEMLKKKPLLLLLLYLLAVVITLLIRCYFLML